MDLCTEQGIREWADERRAARIVAFINGEMTRRGYDVAMARIDVFERTRLRRLDVTKR